MEDFEWAGFCCLWSNWYGGHGGAPWRAGWRWRRWFGIYYELFSSVSFLYDCNSHPALFKFVCCSRLRLCSWFCVPCAVFECSLKSTTYAEAWSQWKWNQVQALHGVPVVYFSRIWRVIGWFCLYCLWLAPRRIGYVSISDYLFFFFNIPGILFLPVVLQPHWQQVPQLQH